jgi:hypothetical protein
MFDELAIEFASAIAILQLYVDVKQMQLDLGNREFEYFFDERM